MAPHGRGWLHYFVGIVLNGVFFAIFGPVVGTVAFLGWGGITFAPFALFVGYAIGAWPAFVTGSVMAVLSSFVSSHKELRLTSVVVGIIISMGLLGGSYLIPGLAHGIGSGPPAFHDFLAVGLSAAVAAPVCTTLICRWGLLLTPGGFATPA